MQRHAGLILKSDTPKGRGVFTTAPITAGTVIETCPVLLISEKEVQAHTKHTELNHYTYNWPVLSAYNHHGSCQAIVFGLGSMFNHSRRKQNVTWERDLSQKTITYRALRRIEIGEELCISYGDRLTFIDAEELAGRESDDESENNPINNIQLGL
ncbi:SET domain-containing protein [Viridothelium virens]|uniref:SET domain-containing protein n=1 Tax=Viridothelium virens TaxID=1048519 RepID=A0A6A6GW17_VIRVR|nr:SET domain-containing protein [Viridothelium virens]